MIFKYFLPIFKKIRIYLFKFLVVYVEAQKFLMLRGSKMDRRDMWSLISKFFI